MLLPVFSRRMFENRGPHMLENDFTPYSALNIFVKDLVSQNYIPKTNLYPEFQSEIKWLC